MSSSSQSSSPGSCYDPFRSIWSVNYNGSDSSPDPAAAAGFIPYSPLRDGYQLHPYSYSRAVSPDPSPAFNTNGLGFGTQPQSHALLDMVLDTTNRELREHQRFSPTLTIEELSFWTELSPRKNEHGFADMGIKTDNVSGKTGNFSSPLTPSPVPVRNTDDIVSRASPQPQPQWNSFKEVGQIDYGSNVLKNSLELNRKSTSPKDSNTDNGKLPPFFNFGVINNGNPRDGDGITPHQNKSPPVFRSPGRNSRNRERYNIRRGERNHGSSPRPRQSEKDTNPGPNFLSTGMELANRNTSDNSRRNYTDLKKILETGVIDKLFHSYGFIKCLTRQARVFFHFSHFEGNVKHLKPGDTVGFQLTYELNTSRPVGTSVTKVGLKTIQGQRGVRVSGFVTSGILFEKSARGRICFECKGECYFLPYGNEDVEGHVQLYTGDNVSFEIETGRHGDLRARFVCLERGAAFIRHKGVVVNVNENYGQIEHAYCKKIYFDFSETRFNEMVLVGDKVEFNIETKCGHPTAANINKLEQLQLPQPLPVGTVIFEDLAIESPEWLECSNEEAEARLAVRRQARAEAREIRMRELEKQQKESDDNADKHYDMYSSDVVNRAAFRVALGSHRGQAHSVGSTSYHSSRRSSEDSSEDGMVSLRDMRHELKELEDKFRKSMVQNAQLDNEKAALTYQVELLKDKIEDIEEILSQLQREHKDKCREYENLKRLSSQLKDDLEYCKAQLLERDELIKEYGLVVVESEVEVDIGNGDRETRIKRNLVTQQSADVLATLGTGSLDVRLKKVLEENNDLQDEIRRLKLDLEEERNHNTRGDYTSHNSINNSHGQNGSEDDFELQREASKQVAEYKFKVQKYEQEIATLQANVARLDGQVTRFKTSSEEAESREDDLKVEKRKLQRELREAQSRLDELETTNSHLQKRLDKLKTAKSTLLKEL